MTDTASAGNRIRLTILAGRLLRLAALAVTGLCLGVGVWLWSLLAVQPKLSDRIPAKLAPLSPCLTAGPRRDWSAFTRSASAASQTLAPLAKRFRLAGTYFEHYENGQKSVRKAVIADAAGNTQVIAGENDMVCGVRVLRVHHDRVAVSDGTNEVELALAFSSAPSLLAGAAGTAPRGHGAAAATFARLGGKRVGERSWVFSREALMNYYNELMNQPGRLVAVFDSMKPVYDAGRRITGYRLEPVGEACFFEAAGLKEGDIIRSVNGIQMTSRTRAEYLIGEFASNRLNVFVLEVERGSTREKQVYQIRSSASSMAR